jgi:hypothetical protein
MDMAVNYWQRAEDACKKDQPICDTGAFDFL